MNKKVNTILFMLAGTVLNIVMMLAIFLILLFAANFVLTPETDSTVKMVVFLLVISLSVVGSFFFYSKVIKWINGKWDLDQYLHPLFGKKRS